jgi:hypothetical protein
MFVECIGNRSSVECILRGKEVRYHGPWPKWIGYSKTRQKSQHGKHEMRNKENMNAKDWDLVLIESIFLRS